MGRDINVKLMSPDELIECIAALLADLDGANQDRVDALNRATSAEIRCGELEAALAEARKAGAVAALLRAAERARQMVVIDGQMTLGFGELRSMAYEIERGEVKA